MEIDLKKIAEILLENVALAMVLAATFLVVLVAYELGALPPITPWWIAVGLLFGFVFFGGVLLLHLLAAHDERRTADREKR
jgi:hypothetical protein